MSRDDSELVALIIWVCLGIFIYCATIFSHFKIWVYHPDPLGHPTVGQSWYGRCLFSLLISTPASLAVFLGLRRRIGLSENTIARITYAMSAFIILGFLYVFQHEIGRWMVG
jgi:hypothetical protein